MRLNEIARPSDLATVTERASAKSRDGRIWSRRRTGGLVGNLLGLRPAAPPDTVSAGTQTRSVAHSAALSEALSEALSSNQQQSEAIRSNQSPHAVVLGEGAAASTATDCLAIMATTLPELCVPSRFLIACDDAP
jgi:hypothetical protein